MKRRIRNLVGRTNRTPRERALDTMPRIRWY
jgi:hypothetical protein